MNNKKMKLKYDNIFIVFSILFLGMLFIFYGVRFIYFYSIEKKKPKTIQDASFATLLVNNDKNLKKDGKKYYYTGKDINNYVMYSGMMFRIISVENGYIKLVSDDTVSSLVMTYDQRDYDKSYANIWLNKIEGEDYSGVFSNYLIDNTKYLVNTNTCIDTVSDYEKVKKCEKYNKDYLVGLLSVDEYLKSGANNGFLNNGSYFWLSNINDNGNYWYVFDKGGLSDKSKTEVNYHSYAIRPTITLNKDVYLISGDGSKETPYVFEQNDNKLLVNRNIGEYLNYGGYLWRIINFKDGNVGLALAEALKVDNEEMLKLYDLEGSSYYNSNYYNYLNTTFINSMNDKSLIVKNNWFDGTYNADSSFDYRHIYSHSVEANVGLLNVGDMYLYDVDEAFLMTPSSKDMVYCLKDNKIFIEKMATKLKMRPVIYINGKVNIKGNGTREIPFEIEG